MNERDAALVRLFAQDEPDADSEAFAAAARRRIAGERRRAKAFRLGLVATIAVVAGAVVILAPEALLYPVQLVYRLLSSPVGAIACALGAVGVTLWSRLGEA